MQSDQSRNKIFTDTDDAITQAAGWNYRHLLIALLIAVLLQDSFLPCLCRVGEIRMRVAIIFDGLVILRIVIAGVMNEHGRGWIFYSVLLYSSPLWIVCAIHHS